MSSYVCANCGGEDFYEECSADGWRDVSIGEGRQIENEGSFEVDSVTGFGYIVCTRCEKSGRPEDLITIEEWENRDNEDEEVEPRPKPGPGQLQLGVA